MFRMWGKIWKDNHLIRDTVICQADYSMSRTSMVFQSLDDICYEFDLGKPMWLSSNINDFKRHAKTRFTKDSFIEQIDFDYLETLPFVVRWIFCCYSHFTQTAAGCSPCFSGQILL